MRVLLIFIASLTLPVAAVAQSNLDTLWTGTYGTGIENYAYAIEQTSDSGYIIAGSTLLSAESYRDVYLIKITAQGDTVWTRTYGGTGDDEALDVKLTCDGGYILTGYTLSVGAIYSDMYLIKTDSAGDTLWTRTYGNSGSDRAYAVQQTPDSGFIMAGTTSLPTSDIFLVKTDRFGNLLWTTTYNLNGYDCAHSLQPTRDGGYIIAGVSTITGNHGRDVCLLKTDAQGTAEWWRTFGGTGVDVGYSVIQTQDNGFLVAGQTSSFGANSMDVYLVKADESGNLQWQRTHGGSLIDCAHSVVETPDGLYVMAGYSYSFGESLSDVFLLKTYDNGDPVWMRTCGGMLNDQARAVRTTPDGGYIIAGSFGSDVSSSNCYVVKTAPDQLYALHVLSPDGGEVWDFNVFGTIRWESFNYEGPVSIEINRTFPSGEWEMLADSADSNGEVQVWVDEHFYYHCRIRVSALNDTISDISDDDFSIVTHQGFVQLIYWTPPYFSLTNWDAGIIECPQDYFMQFRFLNIGNGSALVHWIREPLTPQFTRTLDSIVPFVVPPQSVSNAIFSMQFATDSDGIFHDTLIIETDAINAEDGLLRFPLSGTRITTPNAPAISIAAEENHVRLSWRTPLSRFGCQLVSPVYLVFTAQEPLGPYWFHNFTPDTTYLHTGVLQFVGRMYYRVIATTASLETLYQLPCAGVLTETETLERISSLPHESIKYSK
ncbi:MAG: hypothetical protein ACOZB3_11275 [Calditrichota bacterium]